MDSSRIAIGGCSKCYIRKRRENLFLEQSRIAENIEKIRRFRAAPDDMRKFLELIKNVTELYKNLKPAEKRAFVEIVSSNRLVRGKKLDIEHQIGLSL